MGADHRGNKRGRRSKPVPWWRHAMLRCEVLHSAESSYLVHFPRWATPFIIARAPRGWCLSSPDDFLALGFNLPRFPVKKPVQQPTARGSLSANVDALIERFPALAEHLAANCYEGEAVGTRETSTLLIFCQDGSWKGCLRDRQERRTLWVATNGLFEIFDALENALCDSSAVWRDDRMSGAPEAKRQKPEKRT